MLFSPFDWPLVIADQLRFFLFFAIHNSCVTRKVHQSIIYKEINLAGCFGVVIFKLSTKRWPVEGSTELTS